MKQILLSILLLTVLINISLVGAATTSGYFGIDNPTLPHVIPAASTGITNNNITINNVTNQYYNVTVLSNLTNVAFTNQTNIFNESQYVAEGKVMGFRGNAQSPDNDSYFFYNASSKRLALFVNGRLQQDWGNSTTVYGTATFEEGLQGGQTNETGNTYNISAGNFIGYLDWKYLLNVPKALNITVDQALKLADSGDGNTTVVAVEQVPGSITFYTNTTIRMIIYPNGTTQFYGPIIADGSLLTNLSTYNATYALWAYNQTIAAIEFITNYTYNRSEIDGLISSSIANITFSFNETDPMWTANSTLVRYKSEQINASEVNKTSGTSYLGQLLDTIIDAITGRLDNLEQDKLNATDQRYNDTGYINGIVSNNNASWTSTYNATYANALIYAYNQTQVSIDYIIAYAYNKSEVYNKTEVDSLLNDKLNTTDQRYNETGYINGIVSTNNASWTSTYNATYDLWAYNQTSNTKSKGAQPWLSNDSDTIYFNETYYNQTTRSLAKVNAWTSTSTLTTSGGNGANTTTTILGFLITEVSVYPTSNTTQYKFKLVESASGAVIDQDRATHTGVWRIEKNYAINDSANITITNSNPDSAYTIQIKYIDNFRP